MSTKLLVRPQAYPDEWYWSWIGRTAQSNGLKTIHPSTLGLCADLLHQVNQPRRKIRRLVGHVKICPGCVESAPYIREHWRLTGCEVCPLHACVLQAHCTSCKKTHGIQEVLQASCECGVPISPANAISASPSEIALCKALEWNDLTTEKSALRNFTWRLLFQVARARRGRDIAFKDRRAGDHIAEWLQLHGISIQMTFEGISTFLSTLPSQIHQATVTTWLQQLMDDECGEAKEFRQLPLRQWLGTLHALGAPMKRHRMVGSKSRPPDMPGHLPLMAAARHFKIGEAWLRKWQRNGLLPAIAVPGTNHPFLMVKLEDVQHCQRLHGPKLGPSRPSWTAHLRSIGRCAWRQLRVCGLLDHAGSSRSLEAMPLGRVLQTMTQSAVPKECATTPLVSLSDPRWWRRNQAAAIGQWLQEAGAGNFPIFRDAHVSGFQGLYTSAEQLLRLHRLSAHLSRTRVTPTQADLFGGMTPPFQYGGRNGKE